MFNRIFKTVIRIFVIVLIGGVLTSNLIEYTFSASTNDKPNIFLTINDDGSITQTGNLFDGQLYPSTVDDVKNGIGGINGVIRIKNDFRNITVDNLAIGIKKIDIGNGYPKEIVYNSFLQNVQLKIEKGIMLNFNKTLIEYTKLDNLLYKSENNDYQGYKLAPSDKFRLNKSDTVDLKYSLHMDTKANNELQSLTAHMPIYINLIGAYDNDDDDSEEVVIIDDLEIPVGELNKVDHFQYIQGYPDNTVRPEGLITREEVAVVFYRLLEPMYRLSILSEEEDFSDVNSNRWSIKHIATLSNGNIIAGYPNGTFKPNSPITRAELSTIASKFDKLSFSDGNIFSDIEGHWAIDYINSAAIKGWVNGYPDGTFEPDKYITRAEFVTLVNNVLGRSILKDRILEDVRTFPDLLDTMWYYEDMMEAINSHLYIRDEDLSEIWIEIIYPELDL